MLFTKIEKWVQPVCIKAVQNSIDYNYMLQHNLLHKAHLKCNNNPHSKTDVNLNCILSYSVTNTISIPFKYQYRAGRITHIKTK